MKKKRPETPPTQKFLPNLHAVHRFYDYADGPRFPNQHTALAYPILTGLGLYKYTYT